MEGQLGSVVATDSAVLYNKAAGSGILARRSAWVSASVSDRSAALFYLDPCFQRAEPTAIVWTIPNGAVGELPHLCIEELVMSSKEHDQPEHRPSEGMHTLRAEAIAILLRLGCSQDEAEDIFSHKLTQILQKRRKAPMEELRKLVLASLRRGVVDAWRRRQTRQENQPELGRIAKRRHAEVATPETIAEQNEELAKVRAAVSQLARPYREIVESFFKGLSFRESAEEHDITEVAARKRFERATTMLRTALLRSKKSQG